VRRLTELRSLRLVIRADGSAVALTVSERGWDCGASYSAEPWTAGAATLGRTVVHPGDGFGLTVFRRPPRATLVPMWAADLPADTDELDDLCPDPALSRLS
jgi:hypothetical protein